MNKTIRNIGLTGLLAVGLTGCGIDAEKYKSCMDKFKIQKNQEINQIQKGSTNQEILMYRALESKSARDNGRVIMTQTQRDTMNNILRKNQSSLSSFIGISASSREECSKYYDESNKENQKILTSTLKSEESIIKYNHKLAEMSLYIDRY